MLRCFPLGGYRSLQEDSDCGQVVLSEDLHHQATTPTNKSANSSPAFSARSTRHLDAAVSLKDSSSRHQHQRYTRMPRNSATMSSHHSEDWTKSSFVNKPPRGWLHSDQDIMQGKVKYSVRYIGCLEVTTSMKSLDFETRSQIAKECINRVCEAAGLKTADKKRKIDKRLSKMLSDKPNMDFAGSNVTLGITSLYLNLIHMETGEVIAKHDMPNISFASGGDADTLDFVAYVAKDAHYGRACFVLECGGGLAQTVITTVGQAFELRFKEFLKRTTSIPDSLFVNGCHSTLSLAPSTAASQPALRRDDPEYYNDLPGKVAPDVPLPPPPDYVACYSQQNGHVQRVAQTNRKEGQCTQIKVSQTEPADNLIDLSSEALPPPHHEPEYVNTASVQIPPKNVETSTPQDPFDIQPLEENLPPPPPRHRTFIPTPPPRSRSPNVTTTVGRKAAPRHRVDLHQEEWFHGPISRKDSETLVTKDGDFLVRESSGSPGQYVLTGMQGNLRKHLLLVDPEGVVRTKDRTFDSVSHLVNYHKDNGIPIVSSESALILKNPIPKTRPIR